MRYAALIALGLAKFAILLIALLAACSLHRVPPQTGPDRSAILRDRLAWYGDTLPLLRFATPYVYGMYKHQVETCSGRTKAGWPRFYVAPIYPLNDRGDIAFYASDSKAIVFSLGEESNQFVVRHELLHWILDPIDPADPHPDEMYRVRCGAFVTPNP